MTEELRCGSCGVPAMRRADGAAFHTDALPQGVEYHAPVLDQPFEEAEPDDGPSPSERSTAALESIADSLRKIVAKLYSDG